MHRLLCLPLYLGEKDDWKNCQRTAMLLLSHDMWHDSIPGVIDSKRGCGWI